MCGGLCRSTVLVLGGSICNTVSSGFDAPSLGGPSGDGCVG